MQRSATQPDASNKPNKSVIDLLQAYAYATFDDQTKNLIEVSSGGKLFASIRGSFRLKGLPSISTQRWANSFKELMHQESPLISIDDILLVSHSKRHLLQPIKWFHYIAKKKKSEVSR